ncbi:hypothetical protein SAMN04487969_102449 [Paenibacillus algorifonticola]|uniref:Uncharacterized protein n=1 Tax=Paenibacillus algorifonticola TaxID=684063 RepID=A0A1I2AFM9_9BACL|nr:hypothetical protein [Paenibacillus algorifonticola]SFE42358.1 hypothetical protein SAMN04487969_102449 [Paenibacillus algorifonticola]
MATLIYVPFQPERENATIYVNEHPPTVEAESEWVYTDNAVNQFGLKKPVDKQWRKKAPKHWVDNGWVREKDSEQLKLF